MCVAGFASPGKPLLSTAPCPSSPSTRGKLGVSGAFDSSNDDTDQTELDDTRHAESIATHNFVVFKQSFEDHLLNSTRHG